MTETLNLRPILAALLRLPPEKVAEVRDFVSFLEERYGIEGAEDVDNTWSEEDIQDLTLASLRYAEDTVWGEDRPSPLSDD